MTMMMSDDVLELERCLTKAIDNLSAITASSDGGKDGLIAEHRSDLDALEREKEKFGEVHIPQAVIGLMNQNAGKMDGYVSAVATLVLTENKRADGKKADVSCFRDELKKRRILENN